MHVDAILIYSGTVYLHAEFINVYFFIGIELWIFIVKTHLDGKLHTFKYIL